MSPLVGVLFIPFIHYLVSVSLMRVIDLQFPNGEFAQASQGHGRRCAFLKST